MVQGARSGSITLGVQAEPGTDVCKAGLEQLWGPQGAGLSYCLSYSPVGDAPYGAFRSPRCILAFLDHSVTCCSIFGRGCIRIWWAAGGSRQSMWHRIILLQG